MTGRVIHSRSRRRLLLQLGSLPVATAGVVATAAEPAVRPRIEDVLNIFDLEEIARQNLPAAHWAYMATGVDDDRTVAINHEAFANYAIRARRFVDVSQVDLSARLFGESYPSPVYLSAVSSQRAFHPDAELGTARAASTRSALMMMSTAASTSIEDITAARRGPVWMQLYPTDDWTVTRGLVTRASRAGSPAIVLTVDNMTGRNNETLARGARDDSRRCTDCHVNNSHDFIRKAPMFTGIDVSRVKEHTPSSITWDLLKRLRDLVSGKLLVKGIMTGEDATTCLEYGVDGVVVSNHGGRNEETLHATIDALPEVVSAVQGRIPVLLDGGIRRGTDVFKALALGATAVGIGRPQVWGLAAFGQPGVELAMDILNRELRLIMRQAGVPSTSAIDASRIARR
jgi:4-hydroxymandelate oxidase